MGNWWNEVSELYDLGVNVVALFRPASLSAAVKTLGGNFGMNNRNRHLQMSVLGLL